MTLKLGSSLVLFYVLHPFDDRWAGMIIIQCFPRFPPINVDVDAGC
jgi:hypothetical protein